MKTFKCFSSLMLVAIMMICSVNTTAFAAENDTFPESNTVMEFEITPEMMSMAEPVTPSNPVNNTFNIFGEHTGSSRIYYGNNIKYLIRITDTAGNPVDNMFAVKLYNSSNVLVHEGQMWADGIYHQFSNIPISYGGTYYFKYALAYGNLRTVKIHMQISIQ